MSDAMQQKLGEKYQRSLSNIAKIYAGIGYSVIPIYGDTQPEKAKVATISWKQYQMRRASDTQITQWFEADHYGGVGIVTGRISNLVVIDFDDAQIQADFEKQFPSLLDTRIVTSASRGLSHYYYVLPSHINLPTKHMQGADLLSNGCYVIAPPTYIAGNEYKVQQGGIPYRLTTQDAHRLEKFFNDSLTSESFLSIELQSAPDDIQQTSKTRKQTIKALSSTSLVHLYQHYAPKIGRNNALFKVACYARDYHMNAIQVSEALTEIHAQQQSYQLHLTETEQQRKREAQLTINSAFRIPPKPLQEAANIQLTNSIREALLKRKMTHVARVLDGLFLKGFKQGDVITKKTVLDSLGGNIGKHSILAAFSAIIDGDPIFPKVSFPSNPPSDTSVANGIAITTQTKCYLFSQPKSDKNTRGRIATQFCIPNLNTLCHQLGVPFTRSDPLTLDDIQQAKTYRQAVHRELIKRRPGMYHRYWLARRVGVSKRTSQRYDNDIGIQRKAMFIREYITWKTLGKIPAEDPIQGMFLEDGDGKRYPGLRQIAARLLARKQTVKYCYQDMNYYWYGDRPPLVKVSWGINPRQEVVDAGRKQTEEYLKQYWKDFHAKTHVKSASSPPTVQATIQQTASSTTDVIHHSNFYAGYKEILSESKATYLAKRLYQAVWDRAVNEKSRLSEVNARRLVDEYGEQLVKRVLGILTYRQNIHNPAGFVTVWLRSTAKMVEV